LHRDLLVDRFVEWPMKKLASRNVPLPVRAARLLQRLRRVRGLDDGEKSLHALGLAATPEERWELWARQMRSHGYWKPSKTTASGS
jgi:hypothetical protein